MEYLDIVDENGQPTGEIVEREKAHAEGIMHRTSHVWLVRKKYGKLEVLLQKRSDSKESYPGCYDISSAGHIPAGVDFIPSAVRELKEEIGIDANGNDLIECGNRSVSWDDVFHGIPFHDRQYSKVFALICDFPEEAFILQKEEVSAVRWIEIDEAIDAVKYDKIPHCIYPEEMLMVKNVIEKMKL